MRMASILLIRVARHAPDPRSPIDRAPSMPEGKRQNGDVMPNDDCDGRPLEDVIAVRTQRLIVLTARSARGARAGRWRLKAAEEKEHLKRLFVLLAAKHGGDPRDAAFEAGRHFGIALSEAAHRAARARISSSRVLRLVPPPEGRKADTQ